MTFKIGEVTGSNLQIIEPGIRLLSLNPALNEPSPNETLVYEVVFDNGRRLLNLRSVVSITNSTTFPLEIKVNSPKGEVVLETLQENETSSVPMSYIAEGKLSFKPHYLSFPWTSALQLTSLTEGTTFISSQDDQNREFHYFVHVNINSK